jgi:hypothetical protein
MGVGLTIGIAGAGVFALIIVALLMVIAVAIVRSKLLKRGTKSKDYPQDRHQNRYIPTPIHASGTVERQQSEVDGSYRTVNVPLSQVEVTGEYYNINTSPPPYLANREGSNTSNGSSGAYAPLVEINHDKRVKPPSRSSSSYLYDQPKPSSSGRGKPQPQPHFTSSPAYDEPGFYTEREDEGTGTEESRVSYEYIAGSPRVKTTANEAYGLSLSHL